MPYRFAPALAAAWLALMPAVACAQDASMQQDDGPVTAEEALYNADEMWKLNPQAEEEEDPCEQAPDPDVIVVCRESVDPERYMFERTTRADTEVNGSGAPRAHDPGGLLKPCNAYTFCAGGLGEVPPPAIEVDFEAFPETPAGSAAARWGGPTDADAIAERENRVGAESVATAERERERPDIGIETQRGIEDDVYGP